MELEKYLLVWEERMAQAQRNRRGQVKKQTLN